ncbi:MAG: septal ring lytic transglycosylase RlpA family protein [Rhizobiaceae bacterium]
MKASTGSRRLLAVSLVALSAAFLASCSSSGPKPMIAKKLRSKEYFSEKEYGVKASPRVSHLRSNLPRGGGRDQLGQPYQVRGKWYYPKEDKSYKKVGAASWYGDAFHGRLTANGEIYDMTHLTAAHPTMPLPSYARVTNRKNGSSVIVRVNDRGPYAHGRIIDLSRKAAEMLDYAHSGIADVKVEYVGRAPLEGRDDQFLLASYRPGAGDPASDGLPTGVMIAMNGPTPNGDIAAPAFPGELSNTGGAVLAAAPSSFDGITLPDIAPIAAPRPDGEPSLALATLGYAADTNLSRLTPFASLENGATSWKQPDLQNYVMVGSFEAADEANALAGKLTAFGRVEIETADADGKTWRTVNLHADGRYVVDDMLRAAWDVGADGAMTIHD